MKIGGPLELDIFEFGCTLNRFCIAKNITITMKRFYGTNTVGKNLFVLAWTLLDVIVFVISKLRYTYLAINRLININHQVRKLVQNCYKLEETVISN